jgi:PAS domain S-box-containing protein
MGGAALVLAVEPWWHSSGENVIWVAGVVTALGIISRTRPARWLYRRLVGQPVTEWSTRVVGQVVDDKVSKTNGGSSLRDRVEAIVTQQETLAEWTTQTASNQDDIKQSLENIHKCLDTRFSDTHARMEKLTEYSEEVLAEAIGARERIRQLYRALETPVFEANSLGWCTYVNPAYCRLTGLTTEEALGEGWGQAIHPQDRSRVFKTWERAVEIAEEFTSIYRFRNVQTGETIEVRGSAAPLHDAHRKVVGWVGTLDPIEGSTTLGVPQPAQAVEE